MQLVELTWVKLESVSLVTNKITVIRLIQESGLVQEGNMMTPTRVETRPGTAEIMETNTSKPWDTFWCNDKGSHDIKITL